MAAQLEKSLLMVLMKAENKSKPVWVGTIRSIRTSKQLKNDIYMLMLRMQQGLKRSDHGSTKNLCLLGIGESKRK